MSHFFDLKKAFDSVATGALISGHGGLGQPECPYSVHKEREERHDDAASPKILTVTLEDAMRNAKAGMGRHESEAHLAPDKRNEFDETW
ncbi:hypothetical protein RB195_026196 [Necator americanus]|uniref:Reverse transcriptase domain-containing protein n=1 Tax=Necator americanus TaxID=51031 RepID=A0ABR1EVV6_NECAM